MARTKKSESVPVRLRIKELKGGNKSLYLDIYVNGKRSYEFLKLFLVPEISPEMRERNEHTLKAANAIKSQRILEIANNKPVIELSEKTKVPLIEWMNEYAKFGAAKGYTSLAEHIHSVNVCLEAYNPKIRIGEVDKEFLKGFITYLGTRKARMSRKPLSKNTISGYCGYIRAALNYAVEIGTLGDNPLLAFDWASIEGESTTRDYLTIEEVQKLIDTPYPYGGVRNAFLFSCFSGLRYSDVKGLRWHDVIEENDKAHIELQQQKTGRTVYIPLSRQARRFMPQERGKATDHVFQVTTVSNCDSALKTWAKKAGITKHVSFHVARHAFATMTLTTGADIYTTSQLLGHTDVKVTQVYGKIVDKKKVEAVYMIDKLFED